MFGAQSTRAGQGRLEQRASRHELQGLVSAAPVGMAILDQDMRYVFVNEELARMNGCSIGEHLGSRPADVLAQSGPALEQIVRSVLATGRAVIGRQLSGVRPSRPQGGDWIGNYYPLCLDADGRATRVGAIIIDVTERVRASRRSDARYAITRGLADADSIEAGITAALKAVCEGLDFELAVAWRSDERLGAFSLHEAWPVESFVCRRFRAASDDVRFTPGDGMLGAVLESGRPVWSSQVRSDARIKRRQLLANLDVETALWFPMLGDGQTLGVIECFSDHPQQPDQDLLEMMAGVGVQIGGFLERLWAQQRLRESEQRRRELLQAMLRTAQRERTLIASELHDDTIQVMSATLLTLDQLQKHARESGADTVAAAAARSREILADATERTRQLMFTLRPPLLEASGLKPAIRALLAELGETHGFRWHLDATSDRYPWIIEELVFRGVREAVINAAKHAHPTDLWVSVRPRGERLKAVVRDNGSGFDPEQAFQPEQRHLHLGFDTTKERLRLAGGDLVIRSRRGSGSSVTIRVPLSADENRTT